jgi:hypothetical protein
MPVPCLANAVRKGDICDENAEIAENAGSLSVNPISISPEVKPMSRYIEWRGN